MFRISGLAVCILRGITYEGDQRIQRCIFLEKATGEVAMSGKSVVRGTKYMPLSCKFFLCDSLNLCEPLSKFTFISVLENGMADFRTRIFFTGFKHRKIV